MMELGRLFLTIVVLLGVFLLGATANWLMPPNTYIFTVYDEQGAIRSVTYFTRPQCIEGVNKFCFEVK